MLRVSAEGRKVTEKKERVVKVENSSIIIKILELASWKGGDVILDLDAETASTLDDRTKSKAVNKINSEVKDNLEKGLWHQAGNDGPF